MPISTEEAQGLYTQAIAAVYKERNKPNGFLRTFFPAKTFGTLDLTMAIMRGTERVAVDILRGTTGNRNTFGKETLKTIRPPLYDEYFDATELDIYHRAFASENMSASVLGDFATQIVDHQMDIKDLIDRAIELQCAQVFIDGKVVLKSADTIDFKRKAASIESLTGTAVWANAAGKPLTDLNNAGNFLRQEGKIQGGVLNAIMSQESFQDFQNNDNVLKKADIKSFNIMDLSTPQQNSEGGVLHGYISTDNYRVNIWTYPDTYEVEVGGSLVRKTYVPENQVWVLPERPNFMTGFGAIPQLISDRSRGPIITDYLYTEYMDERRTAHEFHVKSAPVVMPIAIDQVYTINTAE